MDLLGPAPVKITQDEYQAKRRGQKKLDRLNAEIVADGLKLRKTEFQTQKDKLRRAIDDIAEQALDFENFQMLLLEKYEIEANAKRGRVGYKVKDREKHITERALGSHYGLAYREEIADYEEAIKYLKGLHPDGKFPTLKSLYARKSELVDLAKEQKSKIYELGNREKELTIADSNVTEIMAGREKVYTLEKVDMLRSESGNRAREENTL